MVLNLRIDTKLMAAMALRVAVEMDDLDLAKLLLATSQSDFSVRGALYAACFGKERRSLAITRCLIDAGGALPDAQALCYAVCFDKIDVEMVKALIGEYGLDPNDQWNDRTALASLVLTLREESESQVAAVQLLIDLGADPNCRCGPGSALEMAISKGNRRVAEILIAAGANLSLSTAPIQLKWQSDSARISGEYDWASLDAILGEIASILDPTGHARKRDLLSNILQHCPDDERIFNYLTKLQACVNDRDTYNWTPLMEAAHHGKTRMLEYLITLGADVNKEDKWGKTELMFTAKRDLEAPIILVSAWADIDQADSDGVTVLWYAIGGRSKRVCVYLLSLGAAYQMP